MDKTKLKGVYGTFASLAPGSKSRGMAKLVIEVPEEHINEALQALGGYPVSASEKGVAIILWDVWEALVKDFMAAGIDVPEIAPPIEADQTPEPKPEPRKLSHATMTLSQRAAERCGDVRFQAWLARELLDKRGVEIEATERGAATYLRGLAGGSRSNFDKPGYHDAAKRWQVIDDLYQQYLDAKRFGKSGTEGNTPWSKLAL